MSSRQALLVVDAQVNMFDEEFAIYQADEIVRILNRLVEKAKSEEVPIIYIRNNGGEGEPDEPGTPGWEIHPSIAPRGNGIVIDKQGPDAFQNAELKSVLDELGIGQLVIAGMQTEMCIETSVRKAVELGYEVILVADGHSTFDFDDLNAVDEIKRVNEEIGAIAKVVKAERIVIG